MAISELQVALIGAGAAAVSIVWAYNAWQEHKHRKTAERIFKGGQPDALLGDEPAAPVAGERREPRLVEADAVDAAPSHPEPVSDEALTVASAHPMDAPVAEPLPAAEPVPVPPPEWPPEHADVIADCIAGLFMVEPVPAPAVRAMQNAWAADLGKALHWLAQGEADGNWRPVDASDTGRYRNWVVALQLADRRGPLSDGEVARFLDGVQQIAQQTGARADLPARGETVLRAGRLDQFCAGVDIQFVLHVVAGLGGVFAGTKLRAVAEAAGLALEADGVFRARDAAGGEVFTVANLGTERLDAESIKSLATHGLTLSLDVPRVTDGVAGFDRMLSVARQLAATLGGELVDAQRAPLSLAMIDAIRAKTAELQMTMREGRILPGSVRALRLFS